MFVVTEADAAAIRAVFYRTPVIDWSKAEAQGM
jgi:hypothetical protein